MKNQIQKNNMSDSEILEGIINNRENGIAVIPPRKSSIEPERDWWLIDRAILLPADTTVILQNCKIKLSDKCRDNFFRSANCGYGIENIERISNIHIHGEGRCILEGADHPRAVGDSSKILAVPCPKKTEDLINLAYWIPEERKKSGVLDFWDEHGYSYGTDAGKEGEVQHGDWRGIGILFACVDNFSIENMHITDTHGWALSLEDCAYGRIEKLDFDMCMAKEIDGMLHNMENQDGIDLRNGCHDILISDITGGTGDDIIALTAIADTNAPVRPSGTYESTHIMHNDWKRRSTDIHDIIIKNVIGCSKGGICNHVRLLPANCKIWNVVIDSIIDNSPADVRGGCVLLLGEWDGGYGKNATDSMQKITISNIISASSNAINVYGYLSNSVITNVIQTVPGKTINVGRENGMRNVLTSNILEYTE